MGNSKVILTFDAPSGYHQCEIAQRNTWKTAFVCVSSLRVETVSFQIKVVGVHVRMGHELTLEPMRRNTQNYSDDIAVHSDSWESIWMNYGRYCQ